MSFFRTGCEKHKLQKNALRYATRYIEKIRRVVVTNYGGELDIFAWGGKEKERRRRLSLGGSGGILPRKV